MLRSSPLAHLDTILQTMLAKGGHSLTDADVMTLDPMALTAAAAKTVGESVTPILRDHTGPANAVDELLSKYAARLLTVQTCAWFTPMLEVVVTQLLTASLGAGLRLAFAAGTSVFDIGSDIYSIAVYFLSGQSVVRFAILAMVLLCAALPSSDCCGTQRAPGSGRGREGGADRALVPEASRPHAPRDRGHRVDGTSRIGQAPGPTSSSPFLAHWSVCGLPA